TPAANFVTISGGRGHVIDKLQRNTKRYEELQALISDPAVIRDQKRYRELRQEHASLADLVEEFQKYRIIEAEIAANAALVDGSAEKELKELAREEIATLEKRRAGSLEKL